ncbi:MAG: helix-turn-helix domain-containing protein [Proteobacteria bacterium]|nr:helix-turn-helix domain-containing protein [Pseudomonadota bacterium]
MENLPNPRGQKRQIDWRHAAQMLAEGQSTTDVATVLGCSRQTVWRILRKSDALRSRTRELRRRDRAEYGARLLSLRGMVVETIHQAIADGDKQMTRWLADRLGMHRFDPLDAVASEVDSGGEQLDAECLLDRVASQADAARAAETLKTAEADAAAATAAAQAVAADPVAVTIDEVQGDKCFTVALRNALSRRELIVTRQNAVWPPLGVFADD